MCKKSTYLVGTNAVGSWWSKAYGTVKVFCYRVTCGLKISLPHLVLLQ